MTTMATAFLLSPAPFTTKPPSLCARASGFTSLKSKPVHNSAILSFKSLRSPYSVGSDDEDDDLSMYTPASPFTSHKLRRFMHSPLIHNPRPFRNPFTVTSDDGDDDCDLDYDLDHEMDLGDLERENMKDYDYEAVTADAGHFAAKDIAMEDSKTFTSTLGWESETVVDYKINEDEFHKIGLHDCDFFIRKPPDPDNDVYDFREMYVTPPDTDVYAIPKVLAPMPQEYIRCAVSDYGGYIVTKPPIDALRDPMYKCEKEITKVFLTKHYKNRRFGDPEFTLDFEEIYVIDAKTRSITRAKVWVTIPEGKNRDRKNDLLIIRDNGNSFKVIHESERETATTVIGRKEWAESRAAMERHLSKLRDFDISNWF